MNLEGERRERQRQREQTDDSQTNYRINRQTYSQESALSLIVREAAIDKIG